MAANMSITLAPICRRKGKAFSLPDGELAGLWFGYLKKMFPEFDAARVNERHLFRFRAAQHIVDTRTRKRFRITGPPCPGFFWRTFRRFSPRTAAPISPCAKG